MGKTTIVFNNQDEASLLKIIADLESQLKAQQRKAEKAAEQIFYYQEIINKVAKSLQTNNLSQKPIKLTKKR